MDNRLWTTGCGQQAFGPRNSRKLPKAASDDGGDGGDGGGNGGALAQQMHVSPYVPLVQPPVFVPAELNLSKPPTT